MNERLSWKENPEAIFAIFDQEEVIQKYYKEVELEKIEKIDFGGVNTFLIIPKEKNQKTQIYRQSLNDQGEMDETFYKEVTGPFYLTCNESDLYSNALLKIENENQSYEYSPYYSLKDGHLMIENYILYIQQ